MFYLVGLEDMKRVIVELAHLGSSFENGKIHLLERNSKDLDQTQKKDLDSDPLLKKLQSPISLKINILTLLQL